MVLRYLFQAQIKILFHNLAWFALSTWEESGPHVLGIHFKLGLSILTGKVLCVSIDSSFTSRHSSVKAAPPEEENLAQVVKTCHHPDLT